MRQRYSLRSWFVLLSAIALLSCNKMLEVGPPSTHLTTATIFKNDAAALSAQLAIYAQMEADGITYNLLVNTGLSADELVEYTGSLDAIELYTNNLSSANWNTSAMWTAYYKYLYQANAIIEGLEKTDGVTAATKKQLLGEAKFIRAFCHFYLVNLFGNIPLVLTTNYAENAVKAQHTKEDVYTQVMADLLEARDLMAPNFLGANGGLTAERVRPTRWAAMALLAKLYLYTNRWSEAAQAASEILSATALFSLVAEPGNVFLKNTPETIWQLMPVIPQFNSYIGAVLQPYEIPAIVALTPSLATSFEPGDKRFEAWVKTSVTSGTTYFLPHKYKIGYNVTPVVEYTTVMRLAEMYLVRAEARVKLGDLAGALSDINTIRSRAGLAPASTTTGTELLVLLEKERRVELFAEMGDRWLDIRRTGRAAAIMQPAKGADWTQGVDELYPIPQTEISRNPGLKQNPGY